MTVRELSALLSKISPELEIKFFGRFDGTVPVKTAQVMFKTLSITNNPLELTADYLLLFP